MESRDSSADPGSWYGAVQGCGSLTQTALPATPALQTQLSTVTEIISFCTHSTCSSVSWGREGKRGADKTQRYRFIKF